jgi:hypothetical protein
MTSELLNSFNWKRSAKEIALVVMAPKAGENISLCGGFNALCNNA